MAFPESLKNVKVGDLDERQTELLYGALEELGVDEVLDSSRSLAFLEKHYENEAKKGALANQKALRMIEAILPAYRFAITQAALSKDSHYGVFLLEETIDYTADKGMHTRITAFKVSREGVKKVHKTIVHEKSKKPHRPSISHVSDKGIVIAIGEGKTIIV